MRWAAILILLAACSAAPEPQSSPAPTPTATPEARRYPSLEAIYAELECESTDRVGAGSQGETLKDMGHCYQPWGTLEVYLTRDRDEWEGILTNHEPAVVGPNWIILAGTPEVAHTTQGLVGGRVTTPSEL